MKFFKYTGAGMDGTTRPFWMHPFWKWLLIALVLGILAHLPPSTITDVISGNPSPTVIVAVVLLLVVLFGYLIAKIVVRIFNKHE